MAKTNKTAPKVAKATEVANADNKTVKPVEKKVVKSSSPVMVEFKSTTEINGVAYTPGNPIVLMDSVLESVDKSSYILIK